MDGDRRLLVIGNDGDVAGVNRKGLFVPLPQSIVETAKTLPHDSIVDGELIGETLYAFDAQRVGGEDLTSCGFAQRFVALRAALNSVATNIRVVPCVEGSERRTFAQQLRDRGAEGVVVRNSHAPYTPGRPSSGGSARKFKHYATASVVTIAHNDRHSIVMGVYDGRGTLCDVGSVTIPPSKALPSIGAVLEVRYLYAFPLPGGCLYQPTFLAVRDDIDSSECGVEQLIFKADVAA
jgi:bifunctional non-homologous end joining protein LigD